MKEPIAEPLSDVKIFGFWLYLMTDLILFAILFATFAVLRHETFGGPSARELFNISYALASTVILLISSFTCSLATFSVHRAQKKLGLAWFLITFLLGISFLVLEFSEFKQFVHGGASWQRSAFLSSFFALVGMHGLHVSVGLLWMVVVMFQMGLQGLSLPSVSRILRLALFWHFLDVIWIFIFTVVYGMGHLL